MAMLQGGGLRPCTPAVSGMADAASFGTAPAAGVPAEAPPGGISWHEAGVDVLHSSHQVADAARPGFTLSKIAARKGPVNPAIRVCSGRLVVLVVEKIMSMKFS